MSPGAYGQGTVEIAAGDGIPAAPADDLGRGTPRSTADGFLEAIDEGDYEKAAEFMDLRNLRGEARGHTGPELARRLFVIISRADWVDVDELVDDPRGRMNDGLPDYRDSIGLVRDKGREVRLLMQKVPRGDGVSIWKISNATVSIIPSLYEQYGYPAIVEDLRRAMPDTRILGYELFKLIIIVSSMIVVYGFVLALAYGIRRAMGDPDKPSARRIFRFLALPFGVWLVIITVNAIATSLGSGVAAEKWREITPFPVLVTVWVIFAAINLFREIYSARLQEKGRIGAAVLLQPAGNAIKLLIAVGAILVYLDQIGINITTVLAGLGVGGIAVALALQKPMEDVFGAFTLYTQQPVRVGDFCRIGTETGTIEEIGLRTTRVRTLANTVIAIPNAQLANEPIENISARRMIRYQPVLRLRFDTTPEQIRTILQNTRDLLSSTEVVRPEAQRVRFNQIADDALLVAVNCYLDTTDWMTFLELAEQLNLQILDIIHEAGTSLSLPARTLHVEHGEWPATAA